MTLGAHSALDLIFEENMVEILVIESQGQR